MRILIFGIISFFGWSTLSTYVYVCKIKELCNAPVSLQISEVNTENSMVTDTIQKQLAIPKDFIVYFAFDKSAFSSNSATEKYFNESNAYLNQNKQSSLKITGYADAIGTKDYNQLLGYRRAQTMQLYFEHKGMKTDKITILSLGENEPADNNNTEDGRANNRRTVLTIK